MSTKRSKTQGSLLPVDPRLTRNVVSSARLAISSSSWPVAFAGRSRTFATPPGLAENVSRGRQALVLDIVNSRKAFDAADVMMEFHQCNKNGKVLLINNEVPCAGLDLSIERFQNHIQDSQKKKESQRTPDDGVRCAGMMLDTKCRGTVGGMMTNKKDRNKSDVAGDHVQNFFDQAAIDFLNPQHKVPKPSDVHMLGFPAEDVDSWDPDNEALLEHERDGKWLMDAWFQCAKPKCRHSLNKWNKDTGGGDGAVWEFINCCGHDRWLGWVFALDCGASFLLASSTCGRMPARLQLEAGWDDAVSELGNEEDARSRMSSVTKSDSSKGSKLESLSLIHI